MIYTLIISLLSFSLGMFVQSYRKDRMSATEPEPIEVEPEQPVKKVSILKKLTKEKDPEAERVLTEAFLKREAEEARQKILKKEQYQIIMAAAEEEAKVSNDRSRDSAHRTNSICTKCRGTQVSNVMKYDATGKSHKVNSCKTCSNEWEIASGSWKSSKDIVKDWLRIIGYFLQDYRIAKTCTFDPDDLKETYNSLEEKKTALINKATSGHWPKKIQEVWIERKIALESIHAIAMTELYTSDQKDFTDKWDPEALAAIGLRDIRWREQEKRDITGILDL